MPNNVQTQLQKAKEMRGMVLNFADQLNRRMKQLNETLNDSVRQGFPSDIANTYRLKYLAQTNEMISNLSKIMNTNHVSFLDGVIDDLTISITRQ